MSRTRRLAVAAVLVIGGALALGGVAYAADNGAHPAINGHIMPGVNSNQGPLSELGHISL